MSRFDYILYDQISIDKQAKIKAKFEELDHLIETTLPNGRPKSLIGTKLEEAYMWVGKGIRDEQIVERKAKEIQEERDNS